MAEAGPAAEGPPQQSGSFIIKQRKGFISPTSSFIDFGTIENEHYTQEGREQARYYNPYKNRTLKKPTSDFDVVVHMLKGSIGCGLLAMPKAFSNIGVATGVIFTLFLTWMCIYSMNTLLRMQYIQCQRLKAPFIPLPASMRIGFKNGPKCMRWMAPIAPVIVDFFLISCQLGFCTAYVIFISSSLRVAVEYLAPAVTLTDHAYVAIIFIPVVLTNYIRDLKKLMPLSLVANILIVFSLLCCCYFIFFVGEWKTESVKAVVPIGTWPLFVGTVLFALESVGVIITLEHNMGQPEHFLGWTGILTWCLFAVSLLYMFFGCIGYLKYGEKVADTIFASLPKVGWLSALCYSVYGFCIFLTYPLQCFVPLEILWGNYIRHIVKDPLKEFIFEYTLRTITVIVTFIAALVLPQIDIVISLIGAFCLSTLGMIFPFTLEMVTLYPDELGCGKWIVIKDIVFILFGFGVLILGTYVSLLSVFQDEKKE